LPPSVSPVLLLHLGAPPTRPSLSRAPSRRPLARGTAPRSTSQTRGLSLVKTRSTTLSPPSHRRPSHGRLRTTRDVRLKMPSGVGPQAKPGSLRWLPSLAPRKPRCWSALRLARAVTPRTKVRDGKGEARFCSPPSTARTSPTGKADSCGAGGAEGGLRGASPTGPSTYRAHLVGLLEAAGGCSAASHADCHRTPPTAHGRDPHVTAPRLSLMAPRAGGLPWPALPQLRLIGCGHMLVSLVFGHDCVPSVAVVHGSRCA